jgi:hypothetical protein
MQIIEVTGIAGVRSAAITMRRKDTPLTFLLVPMIHVAAPAFYAEVRSRLQRCDVIVAEGVRGKSREIGALTLAYRFAPRRRRTGLAQQDYATLLPAGLPVVNPDLNAAEVVADLRKLPRLTYVLLLAAPVMGLIFALLGPRVFIDEGLTVEDLPKTAEAEELEDSPIARALGNRRDQTLLAALGKIHDERRDEPITVAVVYGAAHIPAAASGLLRHGYRPRKAEWLTVLTLD